MEDNLPKHYIRLFEHGFVGLQDHMGSDAAIVEAARVSYSNKTTITRSDEGLLRYLMRKRHTSPFEMAEVKFHIRAPIFVLRQLVRHRTANLNEESGRYSVLANDYYVPHSSEISGQSQTNKQSAGGEISKIAQLSAPNLIESAAASSFDTYQSLLDMGVARETARTVLPVGTFSTVVWKCDLHNFLHMLNLRMDETHVQPQTLAYANTLHDLAKPLFPATFAAWENYVRRAVSFSRQEQLLIATVLQYGPGFIERLKTDLKPEGMSVNEVEDFAAKLIKIGVPT